MEGLMIDRVDGIKLDMSGTEDVKITVRSSAGHADYLMRADIFGQFVSAASSFALAAINAHTKPPEGYQNAVRASELTAFDVAVSPFGEQLILQMEASGIRTHFAISRVGAEKLRDYLSNRIQEAERVLKETQDRGRN
jgi:hypothetical protein